jgi:putative hydroxymethylpyrimidine transport system substrate-binding protein
MKRMIAAVILLLFSTVIFADVPLETLTVVLNSELSPDHAPLIVAQEQGFFKDRGLNVKFISPTAQMNASNMLTKHKADIGIANQTDFIREVDSGIPLVQIGTLIDKPLDCIVTLKDTKIKSLADLRGKKIGVNRNGLDELMLITMLKNAGLTEKDVEIIPVKKNLGKALLSHKVDAVAGMKRNVDVPALERSGKEVHVFLPEEHGVPNYSVLIFVTNKENVEDSRLPRFLDALKDAVAHLDAHPEQAWNSFANKHPAANNIKNRDMWFATLPYFSEEPSMFDLNEWKHFAEFMHSNQMIKMAQPASHYAVSLG